MAEFEQLAGILNLHFENGDPMKTTLLYPDEDISSNTFEVMLIADSIEIPIAATIVDSHTIGLCVDSSLVPVGLHSWYFRRNNGSPGRKEIKGTWEVLP